MADREDGSNLHKAKLRFHKALQEKDSGSILFFIPDTKDEKEKAEVFENQVIQQLIAYSNMYDSYDKGIDEVQKYLKALMFHYPEEKDFIKTVADQAGEKFVRIVDEAKKRALRTTIERGEMFLKVKRISGGVEGGEHGK